MRAVLLGAGMLNPRLVPALYAAGPAELSGTPGLFRPFYIGESRK